MGEVMWGFPYTIVDMDDEQWKTYVEGTKQMTTTDVSEYEKEIKTFVDAMRYKIFKNRHKGKWQGLKLEDVMKLLDEEVLELKEAITHNNTVEILLEAADVGVVALIASDVAIREAAEKTI